MSKYELAQLNIAHLKAPLESPLLADFVANLDRINAIADASDGFRWRLVGDGGGRAPADDFRGSRPPREASTAGLIAGGFHIWHGVRGRARSSLTVVPLRPQ